jgi:predicted dehydrogenase
LVQDKIKVGLVGASAATDRWGARAHAPTYAALPEVELVAVCTSRPETAQIAKETYGARYAFSDYHAMMQLDDIDMVSVALRVDLHYDVTMAALKAGKHVFCEWPLALSSLQAKEMLNMAQKSKLHHIVGLQGRYAPAIMFLRDLISDGYIGQPLAVNVVRFHDRGMWQKWSHALFLEKIELGGSALTITMGHTIDAALFCLGDEIASLSADIDVLLKEGVLADTEERIEVTAPDNVTMIGRLKRGGMITAQASWSADPQIGWQMVVYGTDGVLIATSDGNYHFKGITVRGAKRPKTTDGNRGLKLTNDYPQVLDIPSHYNWTSEVSLTNSAFNTAQLFRRFVKSIREATDIQPSFLDGVRLHNLLETFESASAARRWVDVPSIEVTSST